jgi:hypothetical protein
MCPLLARNPTVSTQIVDVLFLNGVSFSALMELISVFCNVIISSMVDKVLSCVRTPIN